MRAILASVVTLGLCAGSLLGQEPRPMRVEDLFEFERLSDPQISPNGRWVAYTLSTVDLGKNRVHSRLRIISTDRRTIIPVNFEGEARHPRWSPDGRRLLFVGSNNGDSQLWLFDLGKRKSTKMTDIATGVEEPQWSPDGKWIAFVSSVWPEYAKLPFAQSNAANRKRIERMKKSPVKARVFTRLFFRHWNRYLHNKRRHLFVVSADGGEPKDLTPWNRDSDPVSFTFSAGDDFTFSPDGRYLFFTAAPAKNEAWSTNHDICRVPITGGKIECVTRDNPAADGLPRFSRDGKWFAWRAQRKPGYEADQWGLYIAPVGKDGLPEMSKRRRLAAGLDTSIDAVVWHPSGNRIIGLAEKNARVHLCDIDVKSGEAKLFGRHNHRSPSLSADGRTLVFLRHALHRPADVYVWREGRDEAINVTQANKKLLQRLDLPQPESVTVKGAGGTPMQMWILKPPGFDPGKKWPLIYLVHGGPQGAWTDGWHYRWNAQVWAAQGYVVAMPNPRGSTGFGQKYTEEISRDWGGKVFIDLMKGVDYLEKLPYIDAERMAAAGASYGGYMMNWFQGHTTRFKTLICHAGVYNLESMYGTTEELWFVEWDVGGKPWSDPEAYRKFSPHRFAADFKTPMLILHGELDFRVPVSEGVQMFTTLQRLGVPSRMIAFPDEGHFINKPRNSRFWHRQIFTWLRRYVRPGGK